MAKGLIADHLMNVRGKGMLSKPSLVVNARVETPYPGLESPQIYERKELKRIRKEIKAIKRQLQDWDPEAVSSQAKKSLKTELAIAKARLAEYSARAGSSDDSDEMEDTISRSPKDTDD